MPSARPHRLTQTLAAVGAASLLLYGSRVLLNFFGPELPYAMRRDEDCPLDSPEFLHFLSVVTAGTIRPARLTRLRNGQEFYPAILEAVRAARHSIDLEYYEFLPGKVSAELLAALAERARAGVEVCLTLDAVGSHATPRSLFAPLEQAGGRMVWYHPLRWDSWQKFNNRTHRKLLIVDGTVGFLGGAGIADHWLHATPAGPAWRDTVFRATGPIVAGLTGVFSENWLTAAGEILSGPGQIPPPDPNPTPNPSASPALVVSGTPHDGGTQARILFQALLKSARRTIRITTPYFLPDRSARHALIGAVRRGVSVEILTAGPSIDHPIVRVMSRHASRHLLQAGAKIHEYQPSMIHAKLMTIDGLWTVLGSANFDHRSFALNDEVVMAIRDPQLAATIEHDLARDLTRSQPLTLRELARRNPLSRLETVAEEPLERES